jgi:hypothetical protein
VKIFIRFFPSSSRILVVAAFVLCCMLRMRSSCDYLASWKTKIVRSDNDREAVKRRLAADIIARKSACENGAPKGKVNPAS